MKEKALKLIKHPLIYGSTIVVVGNVGANFFNFLFNLFMSRNLSVADYGILASITTLVGYPALVGTALIPMVVRFAGTYFAKNQLAMVKGLYLKIVKPLLIVGAVVTALLFIYVEQVGAFFHIKDESLLAIAAATIFFNLLSVINIAFLQAKLAFTSQVVLNIVTAILKLLIGIVLVYLGYAVGGAVIALFVTVFAFYLLGFYPLRTIFEKSLKTPHIDTKELYSYGVPSALAFFGLTSLLSTDLLLVKHLFNPEQAGVYAGVALVAKVIFYISSPISSVMFPLIVQKHSKNENFTSTFILSLILVLSFSLLLTLFYFLFPNFTILFFLKKVEYLSLAPLLGLFGLFVSIYCVLAIIVNFYLSIKKTIVYIPILLAALLQGVLIYLFHDSFHQIVMISFVIVLLLVLGLLLYYPHATKK